MMETETCSEALKTARNYYNSNNADCFYATIWGGEDIHVGLYERADETIKTASRRTVAHMAARCTALHKPCRVLDLGSGYGGAARYLAETFDAHVTGINLSEVENARARQLNRAAGLEKKIEIVDGSFESLPFDDATFELVWSQDAILHSGDRQSVLREATRVLCPGGELIFTDPMQDDNAKHNDPKLAPILSRIDLANLGSPAFYERTAGELGLDKVAFEDFTEQLVVHYARVLAETEARESELLKSVDGAYVDRMKEGLRHWIDGGKNHLLRWGVLHFEKPAT